MTPYYSDDLMTLYHGDCREVLPSLSDVDHVLTDPPYGLKFMGKGWDKEVPGVEFWTAIAEACKPGAMMMAFGGTRTFHRLACAIEDGGWEIRDTLCWLYGQGFPKSLDISKAIDKAAGAKREVCGRKYVTKVTNGKALDYAPDGQSSAQRAGSIAVTAPASAAARQWNGWGTALKPAWEPIILAMKALDGTFAANAQRHGAAGLNVDGGRIGTERTTTRRTGSMGRGIYGGDARMGEIVNPAGRWPANVALDEDAAAMLDEQSGHLPGIGLTGKNGGGKGCTTKSPEIYSAGWPKKSRWDSIMDNAGGGASRFFYTAKACRSDRGGRFNKHATVKPRDLLRWLLTLLATPTGGMCLDPFAGSGTTLVVCKALGRKCMGIELDEGHCEIAAKRLQGETAGMFDMVGATQ